MYHILPTSLNWFIAMQMRTTILFIIPREFDRQNKKTRKLNEYSLACSEPILELHDLHTFESDFTINKLQENVTSSNTGMNKCMFILVR